MLARLLGLLIVLASISLPGCYSSHDPDGPDIRLPDGGRRGDAGVRFDAGRPPMPDAGLPGRDAGRPPPSDAGTCASPVPDYAGPGCSAATSQCLATCDDELSCNGCLERDPECGRCVNTTIVSCANDMGCADLWTRFACCAVRNPGCRDLRGADLTACADGCEDALTVYSDCVNSGPIMPCTVGLEMRCGL
ncbi:MAG: hypothetical protein AB7S26_31470 [Sandaracinaceae bacterium]